MAKVRVLERHRSEKYPRLYIERRNNSRFYQLSTFLDGRRIQRSLKTEQLSKATKLADDEYKRLLRGSVSAGRKHPIDRAGIDPTIGELFLSFKTELAPSKRAYFEMKWSTIAPFWRSVEVSEATTPKLKEFIAWRKRHKTRDKHRIKNHTVHKDLIAIRQVLKYAIEEGHISQLPLFPKAGKIDSNPRPWLTPAEWKMLLTTSEKSGRAGTKRTRQQRMDLHDEIRWFVYTMMRVSDVISGDEPQSAGLRFRDCRIMKNAKGERILICEVTGKARPRNVVTTPGAVEIYERRLKAVKNDQSALIFPIHRREAFAELLKTANLFLDKQGFRRSFKSLRATSISFAILAGKPRPDLLAIARNAGTSLLMIDQFYARRLTAEMALDTLSRELPELAGALKRLPQSVPFDETAEYEAFEHEERERILAGDET